MKKGYLHDLQAQLLGSVTDVKAAREHFATDSSIFRIVPEAVVYPRNTADVRKTVTLVNQRTLAGKPTSIVARGKGTDRGGAAIGPGLQLVFPAHMNRIISLEKNTVTVQPGLVFGALQQTLRTHERWVPCYPDSADYSTVGGAVANDASGEKSLKYGTMRNFVKSLKVVLADGSLIQTHRLSAKELHRRKGQHDLEGEIYRKFDSLLLDNAETIAEHTLKVTRNASGYALAQVRGKDDTFDLSQVFIGAQGTLGLITEITLRTVAWQPHTTLGVGYFDDLSRANEAIVALRKLDPAALEFVDGNLLELVRRDRPPDLADLVPEPWPKLVLLVEFDNAGQARRRFRTRRAERILAKHATSFQFSADPIAQASLWKLRRSAAAVTWMQNGSRQALPFIEDAIVPADKFVLLLEQTYKLLANHDLAAAIWGHAGDAHVHLEPMLELAKPADVQRLLKLSREFAVLVARLGGSLSGAHGDGLIRTPYLEQTYGAEMTKLFAETKHIFDPHDIFNPGKKVGASEASLVPLLRDNFHLAPFYDHLPHM